MRMLVALMLLTVPAALPAQAGHDALAGTWVLVPESTPYQGGFDAGRREGGRRGGFGGGGGRRSGGSGGGGFGGGGGGRGGRGAREGGADTGQAQADFLRSLTDAQKTLTLQVHPQSVTLTRAAGVDIELDTTNKKVPARAANGLIKLTRKSRWDGAALVTEIAVEDGPKAEQRYEVISDGLQLRVTTTLEGAGGGKNKRTVTHTYERPDATTDTTTSTTKTTDTTRSN